MKMGEKFQNMVLLSKKWISLLLFLFCMTEFSLSAQIIINEFLADNYSGLTDPNYNKRGDWIEVYNNAGISFSLSGYYLTDDIKNLKKWAFPSSTLVKAKEHLLIWADNENNGLHTNFRLNNSGEFLALVSPSGIIMDSVFFGPQQPDVSSGRFPDGSGPWFFFNKPTPGFANNSNNGMMAPLPRFSNSRGRYESTISLRLSSDLENGIIRFSIDGSDPGPSSMKYNAPIEISGTRVIKARLFADGLLPSPVVSHTFIVKEPSDLPVFSISTPPDNLWDPETGIYVEGVNYVWGWGNGNFWQDWEKECFVEFLETDGTIKIAQMAGLKIAGSLTRTSSQKSLELIARGKYGEPKFDYRFFKEKSINSFNEIKLRNGGNDWAFTMMADGMMHTLVAGQMDIDYQAYRPAILYLNGQYWGIHNIREMLSSDYVEENHGFDKTRIDLLANTGFVIQGSSENYDALIGFVRTHDLSIQDNYIEVKQRIDIEEYINYNVSQIYFANHDWPGGNIKFWRPHIEKGIWRWILFDLDLSFSDPRRNTLEWAIDEQPFYEGSTDLFRNLMKSSEFKALFLSTFLKHLNSTFRPERVIDIIDSLQTNISDEMPRHINRWLGKHGWTFYSQETGYIETPWLASYSDWLSNVESLRNFARQRPGYVYDHLGKYFGLKDPVRISFKIDPPGSGRILVDQTLVIENELIATYFSNQDIDLRAIPAQRFRFTGWEIDGVPLPAGEEISQVLNRRFIRNSVVTASFSFTSAIPELFINEVMTRNSDYFADKLGVFSDWIEIYNPGDQEIDLAGLYLTDNLLNPGKWLIPGGNPSLTTIGPRGYGIFWADDKPTLGSNHIGFMMNGDGEFIGLALKKSTGFVWIDSLNAPPLNSNRSVGRFPDGSPDVMVFAKKPTPGAANVKDEDGNPRESILVNLPYPVPFSDFMTLDFETVVEIPVAIWVRNLQGNIIRLITSRIYEAGQYQVEWDGRDGNGRRQPPGIYLITIIAPHFSESVKTILLY